MAAIVVHLVLLTAGMAAVEIGLVSALEGGWSLVLLVGLPLIVAGSAGFMTPLLGGARQKGSSTDG